MFEGQSYALLAILLTAGFYFAWQGRPIRDSKELTAYLSINQPEPQDFARKLAVLDIRLAPVIFIIGLALSGVFVATLFLTLFPEYRFLAVASGFASALLSMLLLNDFAQRRARKFDKSLQDTVDVMQAAASVGVPPLEVLQIGANANSGYTKYALMDVVRRLKAGGTISESTAPLTYRFNGEGSRLFVNCLTVRWETGVGFSCLLAALSNLLRERRLYSEQFAGQLSGARYALLFTAVFPYLLIPYLVWLQPLWLEPLIQHPWGPVFVFSAIICQVAGFLWMRKIVRSDTL